MELNNQKTIEVVEDKRIIEFEQLKNKEIYLWRE